jgi:hypothetical protein
VLRRRSPRSLVAITGLPFLFGIAAVVCVACGARGPLDVPDIVYVTADAGDADDTADGSANGSQDGALDAIGPKDAGGDVANPINCALCVGQSCSNQILACVTNQACLQTLNCVFGTCLKGGSVSPACALGCSGEAGPQGILDVLAILQCVTMSCGADCQSVLAGLGAGLGGGGGAGGAGK